MSQNPMPGNPHYHHADGVQWESTDAYGLGQAILTLAYEQRTANMLAALTSDNPELRDKVAERLGIDIPAGKR